MNLIITQKMKDSFLLLLPKWCERVGTTTPLLDYEFLLTTKWYTEQLPILKNPNSIGSDYQVDVVKHLVADGLLTQDQLKFKLTQAGVNKIRELSNPADLNTSNNQTTNWQNSIPTYIVIGVVIVIIGGTILNYVFPS